MIKTNYKFLRKFFFFFKWATKEKYFYDNLKKCLIFGFFAPDISEGILTSYQQVIPKIIFFCDNFLKIFTPFYKGALLY